MNFTKPVCPELRSHTTPVMHSLVFRVDVDKLRTGSSTSAYLRTLYKVTTSQSSVRLRVDETIKCRVIQAGERRILVSLIKPMIFVTPRGGFPPCFIQSSTTNNRPLLPSDLLLSYFIRASEFSSTAAPPRPCMLIPISSYLLLDSSFSFPCNAL